MIIDTQDVQLQSPAHAKYNRSIASIDVIPGAKYGGICTPYCSQVVLNSLPLLFADLLALCCSLGFAHSVTSGLTAATSVEFSWLLVLTALTMSATFALLRLYPGTGLNAVAELGQVGLATTLLFSILLFAANTYGDGRGTEIMLFVAFIVMMITIPLLRAAARSLASRFQWWGRPVIIFGVGEAAQSLYRYYSSHPRLGLRPVAVVNDWSNASGTRHATQTALLSARVEAIRQKHDVFWAVVSTPLSANTAAAVRSYSATFPHVLIATEAEDLPKIRYQMFDCGNRPCILMSNTLLLPLPRLIKSLMDYVLVIIASILCLPLFATIMLLIKLTSPGPAIYGQKRIGKGNTQFWAWKFRTMVVNADEVLQQYLDSDPELRAEWERDHKLKNDPRVTRVGHWLRKTSLDELPQLWNVLRNEMSLVGPRPIVKAEIPKYGEWFKLYEQATPGITGMWQISGRNNTTYDMRVALDSYYVLNWSPWLDLYILARTIKVVLLREGAY